MAPQSCPCLIPKTCDNVMLQGGTKFAEGIKLAKLLILK